MAWTDRVVEFPSRVKLNAVSGQDNVYDLEAQEGQVYVEGTLLNANNLTNETNELIDDKIQKWRFIGQATGKGTAHAISLPNDDNWDEVFVKLLLPSNNNYSYVFHLPRIALTDLGNDGKNVMNGAYINSYDNAEPIVAFETNQVYVVASYFAGIDQGDNATIKVYVR